MARSDVTERPVHWNKKERAAFAELATRPGEAHDDAPKPICAWCLVPLDECARGRRGCGYAIDNGTCGSG